jgi:thioredoxin-related protein
MHKITTVFLFLCSQIFAGTINIDSIVKQAHKDEKQVYLFLHTTHCGYCESMIEFTFDDKVVKKILKKNFLVIDIDVRKEGTVIYKDFTGTNKEFAKHIGYNFYPSSLFFNANANILLAQRGYVDEKTFTKMLTNVKSMYHKAHK